MQNCGMAGRSFEHRNGGRRPFFGPKTGLNLNEDLFFGLHLNLGQKPDWIWVKTFFFSFWFSPNFGQVNGLRFGLENFHSAPLPLSKILRTLLNAVFLFSDTDLDETLSKLSLLTTRQKSPPFVFWDSLVELLTRSFAIIFNKLKLNWCTYQQRSNISAGGSRQLILIFFYFYL